MLVLNNMFVDTDAFAWTDAVLDYNDYLALDYNDAHLNSLLSTQSFTPASYLF